MLFKKHLTHFIVIILSLSLLACGAEDGSAQDKGNDGTIDGGNNGGELPTFNILTSISGSGQITPTTMQLNSGSSTSFELAPATGHKIVGVSGCSGVLEGTTYRVSNIESDCTVSAQFGVQSFQLTTQVIGSGIITPNLISANWGSIHEFNLQPLTGFLISSVNGCDGTLNGSRYSTAAIKQDCSIIVTFSRTTDPVKTPKVVAKSITGGVKVIWDRQAADIQFDLYVANEPGVTPDNYLQKSGGNKFSNVQPGFVINIRDESQTSYLVVTASRNGDSRTLISNEHQARSLQLLKYNDTGLTTCSDIPIQDEYVRNESDSLLDCNQEYDHEGDPIPNGQDADFGRDKQAAMGQLSKVGSGNGGFDFTKLDAQGNPLPANASSWTCVKDNHMNLIWEVKTTDGGLRDRNNTYTWFDPDPSVHGGEDGIMDGGDCSGSKCDTYEFVKAVNQTGLCGIRQWRMPSKFELTSLIDASLHPVMMDRTFFPNTFTDDTDNDEAMYWTGETYYEKESIDRELAWVVGFMLDGFMPADEYKRKKINVRLVAKGSN